LSPYIEIKVVEPPEDIEKVNMGTICGNNWEPIIEGNRAIPFEGS